MLNPYVKNTPQKLTLWDIFKMTHNDAQLTISLRYKH